MIPLSQLASDEVVEAPNTVTPKYSVGQIIRCVGRGVEMFRGPIVEIEIHDGPNENGRVVYLIETTQFAFRSQQIWADEHQCYDGRYDPK